MFSTCSTARSAQVGVGGGWGLGWAPMVGVEVYLALCVFLIRQGV